MNIKLDIIKDILIVLYKTIENLYCTTYIHANEYDRYSYVNNFLIIIWITVAITMADYADCLE